MAEEKIRKRSKHLKVQTNPFKEEEPPPMISPMKLAVTGSSNTGPYDNSQYAKEFDNNTYEPPKYDHKIIFREAGKFTDKEVDFFSFADSITESFAVNYQTVEKLGSPEPIYQYSGTTKQINLSWKAIEDDYNNLQESLSDKINILKSMTYPVIDRSGNPTNPPLVYLKYGQLTEEYASNPPEENLAAEDYADWEQSDYLPRKSKEIFGYITSLSIDYSSQELGYTDDETLKPRMVTFNLGFQQINRGIVGEFDY